jgi:hypothetical protein
MEEQLDDRVGKVSDAPPAATETTAGLIKLEETLSSAQDKAKQLVTLRLKLDDEASHARDEPPATGADPMPETDEG